ncbi:MAG: hypothetical protein HKP61_15170 [Dactylosporangium sp.]|nr:hypothetical protein [Dactylosporangium sp.]NNJ62251.1 hypothetical protein [Dactylosporangium sp.]
MDKYGRRAQRHWQQHLPSQHAKIQDPETFFTQMGDTISDQIEDLADQIAGTDRPGETYLDKLGRLNLARLEAETEVLRETLPQPEATGMKHPPAR